jgi:anti-anti-sigma factor
MKYTVSKNEKYTQLSIEEEKLNTVIAPLLKAEMINLFQSDTVNLILDMSAVKYVDSSGLSALLVANRLVGEAQGLLVLAGITEHVMKLISISKLDHVFNILPTVAEAIDAVFLHEIERDLGADGSGDDLE